MLLDNHIREDQTILRDPLDWAHKWAALVRLISPAFPESRRQHERVFPPLIETPALPCCALLCSPGCDLLPVLP